MLTLFRALPLIAQLGIGLGALTAITGSVAYVYSSIKESGRAEVREELRKANERAIRESDKAARGPDECDATGGVWSQIDGRCNGPQ